MNKDKYLLYVRDDKDKKVKIEGDGEFIYAKFEDLENNNIVFITKKLPVITKNLIEEGNTFLNSIIKM